MGKLGRRRRARQESGEPPEAGDRRPRRRRWGRAPADARAPVEPGPLPRRRSGPAGPLDESAATMPDPESSEEENDRMRDIATLMEFLRRDDDPGPV